MKALVDVLRGTQISSLIKSKSRQKSPFIKLNESDTVRTAFTLFVEHDITALPLVSDTRLDVLGIISVHNLLEFVVSQINKDADVILECKISDITNKIHMKRASQIREQTNLLHLLLDMWDGQCRLDCAEFDCKHLLVKCIDGHLEAITPTDFLRYLFVASDSKSRFLHEESSKSVPCGLRIDENTIATQDDPAIAVFKRLLQNEPLAIVDGETGTLQVGLSVVDFIPSLNKDLKLAIQLLQNINVKLYDFLKIIAHSRFMQDLEPILLHDRFTVGDLIEKLIRLRIHQLWRVSNDRFKRPIGTVSAGDVIGFLAKRVREYLAENGK